MRALPLAWRAFGDMRIHSSSRSSVFCRCDSAFSSLLQPLLLLLQPRRVVALPRNALAAVELEDPAGDVVEEVAIVRDGDDRAGVLLQMLLEPLHRSRRRDGSSARRAAECPAPAAAAGRARRGASRRRRACATERVAAAGSAARPSPSPACESRSHAPAASSLSCTFALPVHQLVHVRVGIAEGVVDLVELFEQIDDRLHALLDDLADGLRRIELRLLLEEADGVAGREHGLAEEVLVDAGEDAQQRDLARAVQTDDADLRAVEIGEVDVLEDLLLAVELRDADHRVDDLVWFGIGHRARIVFAYSLTNARPMASPSHFLGTKLKDRGYPCRAPQCAATRCWGKTMGSCTRSIRKPASSTASR